MRRARGRREMSIDRDALTPPEGVPLRLPVAGLGVRWAAQIADVGLTLVALIALMVLLAVLDLLEPQTLMAVGALSFFVIRVPYYVLAELIWNGQTLGKKMLKIKVVAVDGGPLTAHAIVLRNLMKEAEIFLPATLILTLDAANPVESGLALAWVGLGLLVPLLNPRRRRLGDLMAGTYVIHLPQPVLLPDLAAATSAPASAGPAAVEGAPAYIFLPHQLDHYGAYELQALEDLLRSEDIPRDAAAQQRRDQTLEAVVARIRRKIGYADPIRRPEALAFLRAFYNAQRAHLEQRQLFGDRRADKFHRAQDGDDPAPRPPGTGST